MFRRLARIVLVFVGLCLGVLAVVQVVAELDREDRAVTVTAWPLDEQATAKILRQNEEFDPGKPIVRLNPPVDGHPYAELQLGFVDPDEMTSPMSVQFDPDAPQTVILEDWRAIWIGPISLGVPALVLLYVGLVLLRSRAGRLAAPPPLRRTGTQAARAAGKPAPMASPSSTAAAATVAAARSVVEHVSRRDIGARAVIDGPIVDRTVRRPAAVAPIFAAIVVVAGLLAILFFTLAPAAP